MELQIRLSDSLPLSQIFTAYLAYAEGIIAKQIVGKDSGYLEDSAQYQIEMYCNAYHDELQFYIVLLLAYFYYPYTRLLQLDINSTWAYNYLEKLKMCFKNTDIEEDILQLRDPQLNESAGAFQRLLKLQDMQNEGVDIKDKLLRDPQILLRAFDPKSIYRLE